MAALGWLLNLDFAASGAGAEAEEETGVLLRYVGRGMLGGMWASLLIFSSLLA